MRDMCERNSDTGKARELELSDVLNFALQFEHQRAPLEEPGRRSPTVPTERIQPAHEVTVRPTAEGSVINQALNISTEMTRPIYRLSQCAGIGTPRAQVIRLTCP
jgi:hypothetical protein